MPNFGKKKKSKQNKYKSGKNVTVVGLKVAVTSALASGVATVSLQPSSFNQVAGIADNYEFYRVTRLRFRLRRTTSSTTAALAACYLPGVTDNPPTTFTQCYQQLDSTALGTFDTVPTEWVKVPHSRLISYAPWFKTIVGTPDPDLECQGNLFFAGASTDSFMYEIQATYEFRVPCNTAATPAARGLIVRLAERDRLLKILAATPSG